MSKIVNVIFDVSASLCADGKDAIQTNLLMTLFNISGQGLFLENNIAVLFSEWSEEIYDIDLDDLYDNYTANCMKFGGKANVTALVNFLNGLEPKSRVLLISDGLFSGENLETLKASLEKNKDILFTVAVGADADRELLMDLSSPVKYCYQAYDAVTALRELSYRSFEANAKDVSRSARAGARRGRLRI